LKQACCGEDEDVEDENVGSESDDDEDLQASKCHDDWIAISLTASA
jgi:hypothetical protein